MADLDIRQDFIEGVQEVFTTLFNDGSDGNDGVFLYLLSNDRDTNIYGEKKFKTYKPPKLLVCKAIINPTFGSEPVEEIKDKAQFVVTLKSLQDNNLDVSQAGLAELRRGIMKFHGIYYNIDNINPTAYVEDVFLLYQFECTEDIHKDYSVIVVKDEVAEDDTLVTAEDKEV